LVLGECGGKVLFHPPDAATPKRYHLYLTFEDGSALTVTTQMWGAMELFKKGDGLTRKYIQGMKPTPIDPEFTFEYFSALVDEVLEGEKRSVKGLLTQDQLVPGLGNAIAQDILFRARLHPRHPLEELTKSQRRQLHRAILKVVSEATRKGGRYDESISWPSRWIRPDHGQELRRQPVPRLRPTIEKIQYLGGACYFCPCQR
jgi:formamidopyrimidine-DNA glycosylase